MDLQSIKDELKEMYPNMQGFIQHTLVAEMCLKWYEKQVKNCSIPDVVGQSEQLADKGRYCNDCGDYVGKGCDNTDCKDFKG